MAIPTASHKVKKGETLIGILKKRGFNSKAYKKIYGAPYNSALRKKRPDPNTILPGDVVFFPAVTLAQVKRAWDTVFDAKNALVDPLIAMRSGVLSRISAVRKQLPEVKKELEQVRKDEKTAESRYWKVHKTKILDCHKPWLDDQRSLSEIVECAVVIQKADDSTKALDKFYSEWIKELEDKVSVLESRKKAADDIYKLLVALVSMVEKPFEKAMSELSKLMRETY